MRVNGSDAKCRECGGTLNIVWVSGDVLTLDCLTCGEGYELQGLDERGIDHLPTYVPTKARTHEVDPTDA